MHLLPEEGAQAYFDLKAERYFPVHWGMFVLSFHSWYEPIVKIDHEATTRGINLVAPVLGGVVTVNDALSLKRWWQPLLNKVKTKSAIDS